MEGLAVKSCPPHVCGEAGLGSSWSAHYGSVETVLQGIQCVAVELITPGSHGAQGIGRQHGPMQR